MKFKDEGYIDLDKEVVIRKDGTRLTEADAEELAREAHERIAKRAGRPSLSGLPEKSPAIAVRLPAATRQKLKERAEREGKSLSQLAREALESYAS